MHKAWLLLILLLLPATAQVAERLHVAPNDAEANGFDNPEAALGDDDTAATSTTVGAVLTVRDFSLADPPGAITDVRLIVDAAQSPTLGDSLLIELSGPNCSGSQEIGLAARQAHAIALDCNASWSDLSRVQVEITTQSQVPIGLGVATFEVYHVYLDVGIDPDEEVAGVTSDGPAWLTWLLAGFGFLVVLALVVIAIRLRPGTPDDPRPSLGSLRKELQDEELLEFLNTASHDLASPLTPIRLQLAILQKNKDGDLTEKQSKALDMVKRNVEQMGLLVGDLKEAARVQAGKFQVFPEPGDLVSVARESVETFEAQANEQGTKLKLDLVADKLPVNIDAKRVNQVLYNLIGNAIKFSEGGTVQVSCTKEGNKAIVAVRDTGIGMTKEDAAKLFKPFAQAHSSKEKRKGSGLGLYISKGIIEAHGGQIWCESPGPGEGSTFAFAIPMN